MQRKGAWIRGIFRLLLLTLGLLQIWSYRNIAATDDAIAYLDIGEAYFKGDWNVALNAYWSPLYSWLLGLALAIVKPSPQWEFFFIKLINFLMCVFALFSFEFFLRQLILFYHQKPESFSQHRLQIPEWVWLLTGYTLFLWATLRWTPLYSDTPDLATAALIYLASGLMLQLQRGAPTWMGFAALGATLGLAFLSKTVMFPLALVFLAVSACSLGIKRSFPKVLVALLAFTVLTAPFITAISSAKGHFTIGESGKLNYAWFVTRHVQPFRYWQGEDPNFGTPQHLPRKIFENPDIFEFATPIGGTYPLWHDPSYWYKGLRSKFSPKGQLRVLVNNLFFYYDLFLGILLFSYLILFFINGRWRSSVKRLISRWVLLIPAIAGLGVYAIGIDLPAANTGPFLLSTRYIAPFIVLLFAGVFSSVQLPNTREAKKLMAGIALATTLVVTIPLAAWVIKDSLESKLNGTQRPLQWEITTQLNQLGIQPGDKVAILGAYNFPSYHWARLARVKIVAEVLDEASFWKTDETIRAKALDTIAQTGARAIVQKPGLEPPDSALQLGWHQLGTTNCYAYLFAKHLQK